MAFKLDDIIIDRVLYGVAEDSNGVMQYVLTQLADATINITAETKDAVDNTGTLVKRFYQGKQGEFSANNAMLNVNILAASSGNAKEIADVGAAIAMPKIITVKSGTTATLTGYKDGTVTVNALGANGAMGKAYEKSDSASESAYALTSGGEFTPPTDPNETRYIVKYTRDVTSGVCVRNTADKFPDTVCLTLKALCVDPCSADTVRACYIEMPSFQPSPEMEISLTTDAQLNYTGALQVDYCSENKALYNFYMAEDDIEED